MTQSTKIQAHISSIKSNKYVKASIKGICIPQVRSNFLRVNVDEMAKTSENICTVAQFQGATLGQVFAELERHTNGQRYRTKQLVEHN